MCALSIQLVVAPVALAQPAAGQETQVRRAAQTLQEQATRELARGEREGWRYFDGQKREIRAAEVAASVLATGDYYAVTPVLDEVGNRVGFHAALERPAPEQMAIKVEVLDRDLSRKITARKIRLDTDPAAAEANVLRFQRAMRSISDEIRQHRSELGSAASRGLFERLAALLVPSAHAGNMLTSAATHVSLVILAVGVGTLVFGSRFIENTRVRVTIGVAAIAVAAITYLVGTYFHHEEIESGELPK